MRGKNKFNLKLFIKRALVITLVLALVEVLVIFFISRKNKNVAVAKTNEKPLTKDTTKTTNESVSTGYNSAQVADSGRSLHQSEAKSEELGQVSTASTAGSLAPKNTTEPAVRNESPAAEQKAEEPVAKSTDTAAGTAQKSIIKKPKPPVTLSPQYINKIVNAVKAEKSKHADVSNCVQVRKASGSNVDNAFKIAEYLKSNGFIISGRMTIPSNQKGIRINTSGSCISVTVGSI